jgi:hypothetical protein
MRPRDHLLAGVAALVERDRIDAVQVQHLRDELSGGRAIDLRHAGRDIERAPLIACELDARGRARTVRQYVQRAPGGVRQRALWPRRAVVDAQSEHVQRRVLIAERDPGAQHIAAQQRDHLREQFERQDRAQILLGPGQQREQRQRASLRVVQAGVHQRAGVQTCKIVGELALQEAASVRAANSQHPEVGQRTDRGRGIHCWEGVAPSGGRWSLILAHSRHAGSRR